LCFVISYPLLSSCIWGGVGGLSGAIGPFVGGAVVQAIGWHWIFWINLPVGLALIPVALLRGRESYGVHPRLDMCACRCRRC
jgi:MFS family permease